MPVGAVCDRAERLDHITQLLSTAADTVRIVGCWAFLDRIPGRRPLGGILTALAITDTEQNLIVAVDLPLDPDLPENVPLPLARLDRTDSGMQDRGRFRRQYTPGSVEPAENTCLSGMTPRYTRPR